MSGNDIVPGMDCHVHLDDKRFGSDFREVVDRAAKAGVSRLCNVFLSSSDYRKGVGLFEGMDNVVFCVGIHPHCADRATKKELEEISAIACGDDRVRAIGEIGLDFYRDIRPRAEQRQAFVSQLTIAKRLGLPVVIHARDSEVQAVTILERQGFEDHPVMFHAWNGGKEATGRVAARGKWTISLGGGVTYPANSGTMDGLAGFPADRLVFETDCPYLTPQPLRKAMRRNEPANCVATCEVVSKTLGLDADSLWASAAKRADWFFSPRQGR